ncbi:MAG: vitamin B12-dependent ribonucleotide reductase [Kiritimatiellae bacterium]|nr:vitamin B12-dependent ribonucleotide reductase [Kiritimatiellia bacterium]
MLEARDSLEVIRDQQADKTKAARPKGVRKPAGEGRAERPQGLHVECLLSRPGVHPFDDIEWETRHASITDGRGKSVFELDNVEVPKAWSMLATNVVSSKYFYGSEGTEIRETSARQIIHRVARSVADLGLSDGYFATPEDAEHFYNELCAVCVNQYGAFNSPVWFNLGLFHIYGLSSENRASFHWNAEAGEIERCTDSYKHPQVSACFIQSVDDTMEDIMRLASAEAMLFKYGSGTGTDLSTLRSSREKLSGGGTPSGPLSFMRVFDQVAAVIKSGGKTRRAAKMQSLKVGHPDIMDFIGCKVEEERKAQALIAAGYDGSFTGEAYSSVMFQNANLSVRVSDEFMRAVENDGDWTTHAVTTGDPVETQKARAILQKIAEATHACGDPGLQYDSTINAWHTCPAIGRINASNPCSEYMFVDNSACNLASVNLMKFINGNGEFDVDRLRHVVRIFILAQDILVDSASYPTEEIAANSHRFRPLGLGYANLGALIMSRGIPYDSEQGRAYAAALTALLHGFAYETSAEIAAVKGTFDAYETNRDPMLKVVQRHHDALADVERAACPPALFDAATELWTRVLNAGNRNGFRNAQVTVLAPTGTIGFMMDCDTTGVEPDIALVKYKQLAGGGMMKIVNRSLRPALERLGYGEDEIEGIAKHVDEHDTIEGAPGLKSEHLNVFDCAFKPKNGERCIPYMAHIKMMGAVQPFLSGAISKTINMPTEATVEDVTNAYMEGWRLGLKALAIYRDGSKGVQPVSTGREQPSAAPAAVKGPFRRRMPDTRNSITHKFDIAGHEGYLTVGLYEDGTPGELFITMAKEGSTVGGMMDSFGVAISLCLQYGVPLKELIRKFAHSRFEPSGWTPNKQIQMAKSLVDYIFRWLDLTFPNGSVHGAAPAPAEARVQAAPAPADAAGAGAPDPMTRVDHQFKHFMEDAPVCDQCGAITVRNGACYRCYNCGNSMGCS